MLLDNRSALVTGANRGLGKAIAIALAREGACVAVHFNSNADAAEDVARTIRDAGGTALAVGADIRHRDAVATMIERCTAEFGAIDILVNNARQLGEKKPFLELAWSDYEAQFDVIVKGALHCCQAVLPGMIEKRRGSIVNLLSASLHEPDWRWHTYGAAKGALHQFSRNLATEMGAFGITVNSVSPGFVPTERQTTHSKDYLEAYAALTPLGRLGRAEEVADAVVFLASGRAQFITGADIPVSGGKVMS